MAFSLAIHEPLKFVYTQCGSIVDDHAFRIYLLSFQAQINGMKIVKKLVDTRTLRKFDKTTLVGLIQLAELDKAGTAGREEYIAIVVDNPLIREIAMLYADLVSDCKKAIGFFHDVSPALEWLGYREKEAGRLQGFIRRHRV